ncbi:MAG: mechanosensitive ion channel protein [Ectothiorhodospiraceae bacterium]|nr:mechanosensitive ion channel protein [Ectothiorhodospiraceae bacterium]
MNFDAILKQANDLVALHGLNIVYALVILILGFIVAKAIKGGVGSMLKKREMDNALIGFVTSIVYVALIIFVILAALSRVGVETTSFVAIVGAAGLAIGLALQGSLANFAAGFLLISFKPFKAGDYVEAGGTSGTVEEIQIFTTRLKSPDNVEITIPNAQVLGGTINNYSAKEIRRLDLVVGVGYDDDLPRVREVLMDIIKNEPRCLEDPAPLVGVLELADSSVNFAFRPWVKGSDYWPTRFDLLERIKLRLDSEGFNIPYPQADVHVINEKAA